MYTVRKATRKDIKFVKDNLRKEDMEKYGLTEQEYRRAIKLSEDKADSVVAWVMDGVTHAIGGFKYDRNSFKTSVWAITTPLTDKHPKEVIQAGKEFIDSFEGHALTCCINPTDKRVVKLVESLGFKPHIKLASIRQFFIKE